MAALTSLSAEVWGLPTLDDRLVSREAMSGALRGILDSADFWSFYIIRSRLDWDTGDIQSPGLVIRKGESVELGHQLDLRLIKSRRVRLVVSWTDGGSVGIDVTARTYDVLTPSSTTKLRMKEFDSAIKSGAAYRFISPGFAFLFLVWPFAIALAAFVVTFFTDPATQHYIFHNNPAAVVPAPPKWVDPVLTAAVYSYPLALLVSGFILYVRFASGGLRLKREIVNPSSFLSVLYKVRTEGLRVENWRQLVIGIMMGVLITVLTIWFKK